MSDETNTRKCFKVTIEEVPFEDLRQGNLFTMWDQDHPDGHEEGKDLYVVLRDPTTCEGVPSCPDNYELGATLPIGKLDTCISHVVERMAQAATEGDDDE